MENKLITEIILWKNNRLDRQWTITIDQAIEKFKLTTWYTYFKDGQWPLARALSCFMGADEAAGGLQSAYEPDEIDFIMTAVLDKLKH